MLFVGNQRGRGRDLALHLMKDENEIVQVHEIRGFIAQDLEEAFKEAYAMSKATRCSKYLYSLSVNPPPAHNASEEEFIAAIERVESKLGLSGQPRVIVFHEKKGFDGETRHHAHAVWSRISNDMKAVQLSHDHHKLMDISRDLFIEHDWKMPAGMINKQDRDPLNFSLEEWQQAKRAGKHPKEIKGIIRDCWAVSDSKTSFVNALKEHGYILAQGRRGHVAVDYKGEAYAISRATDLKAKQIRARLGEIDDLPTVGQAHETASGLITKRLKEIEAEKAAEADNVRKRHREAAQVLRDQNAATMKRLQQSQAERFKKAEAERQARIRTGIRGLFDRLTGERKRTLAKNGQEAAAAKQRDRQELQNLHFKHQHAESLQHHRAYKDRSTFHQIARLLKDDIERLNKDVQSSKDQEREAFKTKRRSTRERPKRQSRSRQREGPSMG